MFSRNGNAVVDRRTRLGLKREKVNNLFFIHQTLWTLREFFHRQSKKSENRHCHFTGINVIIVTCGDEKFKPMMENKMEDSDVDKYDGD